MLLGSLGWEEANCCWRNQRQKYNNNNSSRVVLLLERKGSKKPQEKIATNGRSGPSFHCGYCLPMPVPCARNFPAAEMVAALSQARVRQAKRWCSRCQYLLLEFSNKPYIATDVSTQQWEDGAETSTIPTKNFAGVHLSNRLQLQMDQGLWVSSGKSCVLLQLSQPLWS